MPAGRKLAVSAEVDAHAKAPRAGTSRLILADFGLGLVSNVPYIDATVVCGAGQIAAVLAQCQCPDLTGLDRIARNFTRVAELPRVLVKRPDFHLAPEARTGRVAAVSRGAYVVAAKLVSV